jgi:hypothetical protein
MKNKLWPVWFFAIAVSVALPLSVVHLSAQQSSLVKAVDPCADSSDKKNDPLGHDPLADPTEEMRLRAQMKLDEKNFKELQQAADELASVSAKMKDEIEKTGQYAISLRVIDQIAQIEKLTKRVKSRAK